MMRAILLALGLLAALTAPARAQSVPLQLGVTALPLDAEHPDAVRLGKLTYRAGFALTSPWRGFGGLSGMALAADGTLTAISDTGDWSIMRLAHDAEGTLTGVTGIGHGNLLNAAGRAISGKREADAEELVALAEGGWLVAFERDHRFWRYDAAAGLAGRPAPVAGPDGAQVAEPNSGMEAATQLADGRVLVFAEDLRDAQGDHTGWLGDPASGVWTELHLAATEDFVPTGLARLPDGDLVLVERSFNAALLLLKTRLSRIRIDTVAPGARLETEELARLIPPLTNDNLEAVAARRGPGGETLIYVLSDDNFNTGLQRTLLLQFALGD